MVLDNKQNWDLNDSEIAYCIGTLLQDGSGTPSSAMQSYCLAMWHYPEWQLKVQRELDEVVGDCVPLFQHQTAGFEVIPAGLDMHYNISDWIHSKIMFARSCLPCYLCSCKTTIQIAAVSQCPDRKIPVYLSARKIHVHKI